MATLTTVYGVNNTKRTQNNPSDKISSKQNYGNVRVLYDYYLVGTSDEFGTSGLINLMFIPKGAELLDAHVVMEAAGATGIFDLGWAASAELDSSAVALVAADPDGIMASVDPGAAAINARMDGTTPGYHKDFAAEVQVQADWSEVSADSGDDTLEVTLYIAVE